MLFQPWQYLSGKLYKVIRLDGLPLWSKNYTRPSLDDWDQTIVDTGTIVMYLGEATAPCHDHFFSVLYGDKVFIVHVNFLHEEALERVE